MNKLNSAVTRCQQALNLPKVFAFAGDRFFLFLIVGLSCFVRYWGIGFGLPDTSCRPDEYSIFSIAQYVLSGDLNPHFFSYPSLYIYVVAILYLMYYVIGFSLLRFGSLNDLFLQFVSRPSIFFLINRSLTAFLGVATVYVTYLMAKNLYDKKVALVAAFFLGLAYLHVRDSHFGVTDVPVTFLTTLSVLFIVYSYQFLSIKNYIGAGIFAGLAASTKYIGVLLLLPALIVYGLERNPLRAEIRSFWKNKVVLFTLALIFAFLLGTPYALLSFNEFQHDFFQEIHLLAENTSPKFFEHGWFYHMRFTLFYGLGWSLLAAALLGIVLQFRLDAKKAVMLWSFPFIYYLYMGKDYHTFVRYVVPLTPFFCIAAAVLTDSWTRMIREKFGFRKDYVFRLVLVIFIILPSAANIIKFNATISKPDSRLLAKAWIDQNIPPGSSIYQFYNIHAKLELTEITGYFFDEDANKKEIGRSKYYQWDNDKNKKKVLLGENTDKSLPQYIIIQDGPLVKYRPEIPRHVVILLKNSYQLKKAFKAMEPNSKENLFDQQDAFFVPFSGFKGVNYPGPNYFIFEKRS